MNDIRSSSDKKNKIVLVDDNEDLAAITSMLLKLLGFEVAFCHDGRKCLELVESTKPDIVILDIDMPGMDGYQVCDLLRAHEIGRNLPILAYTARDEYSFNQENNTNCFDNYMQKGMNHAIMVDIINRAIHSR